MKKLFLIIYCMSPAVLLAQKESFVLQINMKSIAPTAVAHLSYQSGTRWVFDSATAKNNVFKFKGLLPEPAVATLEIDHQGAGLEHMKGGADVLNFYLDMGKNNIIADDTIKYAVFSNSKLNKDAADYKTLTQDAAENVNKIYAAYYGALPEKQRDKAFIDSMTILDDTAEAVLLALRTQFIKEHPGSFVSLQILKDMADPQADLLKIALLLDVLSPGLQNTASGKALAQSIIKAKATAVGAEAPLFSMPDTAGNMVALQSFRGKYILLDFWASWCVPCRHENPNVVAAFKRFKSKNFTVVGISLDQPGKKDAWLAAIKSDGLEWTQLSDLKFWDNAVAKQYGIQSIPQNYLIDPAGKIIAKNLRGDELEKKLSGVLQ